MMIKVLEIKELEDCFDGSFMKEALLNSEVTKDFISYLGEGNELEYYPNFARPFFKIVKKGDYIIKGVEGNRTIRIILNRKRIDIAEKNFISIVNSYPNTQIKVGGKKWQHD